jgi:PAS domain S-box-containing protein
LPKLSDIWRRWFHTSDMTERYIQRDQWTRDVLKLMSYVIGISTILIVFGVLAGVFPLIETIPIYILLLVILIAKWGANHGGWRWARYLPPLLCLFMGIYFTYNNGFSSTAIFYVLGILLAGMLISQVIQRFTLLLSIFSIAYYAIIFRGETILSDLAALLTVSFTLIGVSILQWYYDTRIRSILAERITVNQSLSEEVTRRQVAENGRMDKESQLLRLTENISDLVTEISPEGIIRYASSSYKTILGFPPEILLGTDAFTLVHPDDLSQAMVALKLAAENKSSGKIQIRCMHANGQYVYLELIGSAIRSEVNELEGFVLSGRDISQQKQAEMSVRESENRFRMVIDSIPMGIHFYRLEEDGDLTLTGFNPAADKILGIKHSSLIGKSITEAFPAIKNPVVFDKFRKIAIEGGMWKNGPFKYPVGEKVVYLELLGFWMAPMEVVTMFEDVTERLIAEDALRLSEEKFSKAFITSPDSININRMSDGMYWDINQGFTKLTGYSREDVIGKTSIELNIWNDPADRARLVEGIKNDGVVENLQAKFRAKDGHIIHGLMSASVLEIDHEKWLLNITRDISDRIQYEEELHRSHQMLTEAYDATLQGWVIALEMREHETADHSRRVVDLTIQLVQHFDMDGIDLDLIQRGALLHDIGKMGVPDSILLKPGPLTDDEWAIMRSHPKNAYDMLSQIPYLQPSLDIPFCHHERWNGEGYPRGLKGNEIPLAARIFAVVDVYDALSSNRPYRPAWPHKDVIQYLIENKGRLFDPKVVDAFLRMINS